MMIQLVIHLVIHHQRKTVQHVSMVETGPGGPASYSGRRWNDRLPSDLCWCTPEVSSMSPPSACHWQCARHRRAPLRCCFEWRFAVLVFHGVEFGVDLSDFNSCGPAGCRSVLFCLSTTCLPVAEFLSCRHFTWTNVCHVPCTKKMEWCRDLLQGTTWIPWLMTDYVAALSKMASWKNEINPSWLVRKTINAQTACRCHRAPNTPFVPRCHVSLPFLPWRYNLSSENNMDKSMKLVEGLMSDLWLLWGNSEVVKPSTSR